jgi:hypothetical protein
MTCAFAAVETLMMDASQALFGETLPATLHPMAKSGGPNGIISSDPARTPQSVRVIRSEWSAEVDTSDNGMGRSSGAFRLGVNATRHIATLALADLAWLPKRDDELIYAGAPARFRIAEVMPDGGAGFRLTLNAV